MRYMPWKQGVQPAPLPGLAVAGCAVVVALLLKLIVDPLFDTESPFLLFFSAVMFSAWYGGLWPGVFATVSAALLSDYFFLAPVGSILVGSVGQVTRLLLFMLEGLSVTALCTALHVARRRAEVHMQQVLAQQAAVHDSEERFRLLVDSVQDYAILMLDPQGRIESWNSGAERITGYNAQTIVGEHVARLYPDTDVVRGAPVNDLALAAKTGRFEDEAKRVRQDGRLFWASIIIWALRDNDQRLCGFSVVIRDITERKQAAERDHQQIQRLAALRTIDLAITGSLDVQVSLNVVLDQVITQLGVDAAAVLLLNQDTYTLEYAAGRGFRHQSITRSRLRLGEGFAGRAALERRTIYLDCIAEAGSQFVRADLLCDEHMVSYAVVPLVAKGQIHGVLEVFHRTVFQADPEWQNFLEALAGQAAIAIDSASMFDSLQRSNLALALAYDTTLEGWSRALDLRDKETEGHTRRVTQLTLEMARALGIEQDELVHIRRGALLHDIGKMGIPDNILLKPGPLTDGEWTIMREHPRYAYELLAPIRFLRPALDIPYCHHERWDGSGYPRGLRGEQIPLAARIFSVVDVWDALTSDRPYRAGWSSERTAAYLRERAGTHFDPAMVEAFLSINGLKERGA